MFFNLSKNNFSEDFVNSALSSLPENSIALTLNHQFYFGGIYEKTVNKKYPSVKLVYLPNYKNRDYEKYHPEIFNENPDYNFLKLIRINDSNKDDSDYVFLTLLSKINTEEIYLLQGSLEEKLYSRVKPYLKPYGVWYKFAKNLFSNLAEKEILNSLNVKIPSYNLTLVQQKYLEIYFLAYYNTAMSFASNNLYQESIEYFGKSTQFATDKQEVAGLIEMIKDTQELQKDLENIITSNDIQKLNVLTKNLFDLKNYHELIYIYNKRMEQLPNNARLFSNLGTVYALKGNYSEARKYFEKALTLDPKLDYVSERLKKLEQE